MVEKLKAGSSSRLLNFMDGVVSSCYDKERVMVFTMNNKEHVDPNLLWPGRVNVHIHFPLCIFSAFKTSGLHGGRRWLWAGTGGE